MRVHVLGGFLGAGKTSAICALAELLASRGERVVVVTNDQGHVLVDTALCAETAAEVTEIGGGCFCCRYGELEQALVHAAESGATVALAEAVGSCTDLVATVLSPLAARRLDKLRLAPLSVLVDPVRAAEIAAGAFPDDVAYLFRKQIEEADVVVLTRADLQDLPDAEPLVREIRPDAPVVRVSSRTGAGLGQWLATMPNALARPLDIDYERYAAAEALLGWANGRVSVSSEQPFAPREVITDFFQALADEPVAHLKVFVDGPGHGSANLVRRGGVPMLDGLRELPLQTTQLQLLVNARVALPPAVLEQRLRTAMAGAVNGARAEWEDLDCFEPGRPVPVHRYATRCDTEGEGACCAAFYQDPTVQYLLGDSLHPGGTELTLAMAQQLDLSEGGQVLDVACGKGTSLMAILDAYPQAGAVGMDMAPGAVGEGNGAPYEGRLDLVGGDVHRTTFEDERFDAILCECALSTFADQPLALREMHRVLRPGGRIAVSDMLTNGPVPDTLAEWVHLGTCLSHARSLPDYAALLRGAGFEVLQSEDSSWALKKMLSQIKRQLLAAAVARAAGVLPEGVDLDIPHGRQALKLASAAIDDGQVGYGFIVGQKPLSSP